MAYFVPKCLLWDDVRVRMKVMNYLIVDNFFHNHRIELINIFYYD